MPPTRIAIVTDIVDPHADVLVKTLGAMGHEPVRVNSSDLPTGAVLAARLDGDAWSGSLRINTSGRELRWDELTAVWWRRPSGYGFPPDLSAWEREFAEEELTQAMRGLWAAQDCYWMSRPEDIAKAQYKVDQLLRAKRLGFEVPRTLVTTEPEQVRMFACECPGGMVYKVLSDPYLMVARTHRLHPQEQVESRFVPTTLMGRAELADLESVRTTPCLFQEYVAKASEFRVTVIADDVFIAELDSQHDAASAVDWRDAPGATVPYRLGSLPDDVVSRCLALTGAYGLQLAAIDLIRTPDGRYVFLEINPNGQFLFVEARLPQLRMAEAVAGALVRGGRGIG